MNRVPRTVKQITTSPPMAPPTIAPRFIVSCLEGVGIEIDVEEVTEDCTTELELDAGTGDVSTTTFFGGEAELLRELLGIEVELDGVVVASAALVAGKSLSVRASAPQAMYSKDWSGPLISSTVEQNCERSLINLSSRNPSVL